MKNTDQNNSLTEISIAVALIALAALVRLLPHVPNATPVAAMALFGGALLPKKWGWLLPVIAMLATDALIGWYTPAIMVSVYGSFLLVNLLGTVLKKKISAVGVLGTSLAGSVVFFILTNFAVWAFTTMYSPTVAGLIACYQSALPFFRNTVLGDLGYSVVLFGLYALATNIAIYSRRLTSHVS